MLFAPSHYAPFTVISVDFHWVPVNFPWWVTSPHISSLLMILVAKASVGVLLVHWSHMGCRGGSYALLGNSQPAPERASVTCPHHIMVLLVN
jgi:hypothetical protein